MIHVIATIEIQAGTRDQFLREFHQIVPQVRAEEGCLEYGPCCDVATTLSIQPPVRENVVVVVEKWESLDALYLHLEMPHMQDYKERVKDMVLSVLLHVLEPAA